MTIRQRKCAHHFKFPDGGNNDTSKMKCLICHYSYNKYCQAETKRLYRKKWRKKKVFIDNY